MRPSRLAVAAASVATAAVVGLWCTGPEPMLDNHPRPLPPLECLEDEPCWDCSTMGNRICGPGFEP